MGRDYLLDEAMDTLLPELVSEAVEAEKLEAASRPSVSVVEREPVIKVDATVPLTPLITLGDYAAISVDGSAEEVTDEKVEESIRNFLESRATWHSVDRALEIGDAATMNIKATVDEETLTDQQDVEYLASGDNPNPLPGFAQQIEGMKAGETRDFVLTVPDEYPREDLIGKNADFSVTVKAVKGKALPDLTDDLVAELDEEELKTVADLRNRVRENLEAQATESLRRSQEEKVLDALIEGSTIELAPLMVEHEAEHIVHDQQETLSRYNISLENYLQSTGRTVTQILDEAKQSAEQRLKRSLVMEELISAIGVEISDQQVDEEIEKLQQDPQYSQDGKLDSEETRAAIRRALGRQAALEKAIEIAASPKSGRRTKTAVGKSSTTKAPAAKKSTAGKSSGSAKATTRKAPARKPKPES
jgi:trigger factor